MNCMNYQGVVISGLPGAGKGELARKLSENLGWPVLSIGDLWRQKYKEKYPNSEIGFEEFWKNVPVDEQVKMDGAAKELMSKGNKIGEFRYAISCKELSVLLVFITANLDVRVNRAKKINKYEGKEKEKIKKILTNREEDEVKVGKQIYGEDYDYRELDQYDVILDSSDLNIEEEIRIIKGYLEGKLLKEILKEIKFKTS